MSKADATDSVCFQPSVVAAHSCLGNGVELKERWMSIVHRMANVLLQCAHQELSEEERQNKEWLKKGSPSHEALKSVVLDKKLLKDISKLSQFCHTGILEVYHSLLLKYCPKRQQFSYKGMIARTQLEALDHNNNVGRSQSTTSTGEEV